MMKLQINKSILSGLLLVLLAGCASTPSYQQSNSLSTSRSTASAWQEPSKPSNSTLRMYFDIAVDQFKMCLTENELFTPPADNRSTKEEVADRILAACDARLRKVEKAGIENYMASSNLSRENAQAATQATIEAVTAEFREKITGKKQREKDIKELNHFTQKEKVQQKKYTDCLDAAVNQKYLLSGSAADVTLLVMTQCDVELRAWSKDKFEVITLQNSDDLSIEKSKDGQDKLFSTLSHVRNQMWDVVLNKIVSKREALRNAPPVNPAPTPGTTKKSNGVDI